ncbi:MAG: hypothetical protein RLY57_38 [Candidatus Parcubacteria bacterium]|jgi:hypothetical protein
MQEKIVGKLWISLNSVYRFDILLFTRNIDFRLNSMKTPHRRKLTFQYLRLIIWNIFVTCFGKNYKANKCGHKTKRQGCLTVFGDKHYTYMRMPLAENETPDYCLECIGKMSIRCAWCGEPIHIGDPVIASIPLSPTFELPAGAHSFRGDEGETVVLGCLRWDCADSGIFRNGFWNPPGVYTPVPSPLDLMMSSGGIGMVIVSDLGDQHNIGKVHPSDQPAG